MQIFSSAHVTERVRSIHITVDPDDYTQRRACNCICKAVYHVHMGELDESNRRDDKIYSDKPEAGKHVHESTSLARLPGAQDGIHRGPRGGVFCGLRTRYAHGHTAHTTHAQRRTPQHACVHGRPCPEVRGRRRPSLLASV